MNPSRKTFLLVCCILAFGTLVLYWPVTSHPFIIFDDDEYVSSNPHVTTGLSWNNFVWAFTTTESANWHPLTWLSHQLDCTMFGLDAGGHHLVNVLLHAANALLVFLLLRGTTGSLWRSAVVAALFAWHPLRVESVAWASERKDVLCAFFFLLALLFYSRFVLAKTTEEGQGAVNRPASLFTRRSFRFFWLAWLMFALALLSKPMAVTLPFVLLLLDVWPLNRLTNSGFRFQVFGKLIAEKLPFFLLTFASCAATFIAQRGGGAVSPVEFSSRLANVPVTYARYISKTFWPADLSIVYPYVYDWPWLMIGGAVFMVAALAVLGVMMLRTRAWLAVGWFWYLGTLVPAIGLVQVGAQSMADRYTYLPIIGFLIVVVWGVAEVFARHPRGKVICTVLAAIALIGCVLVTPRQLTHWRSSVALFRHALDVTPNNYVAANVLGNAYEMQGEGAYALVLYRSAVETEPRFAQSQFNYGMMLLAFGDRPQALEHLQAAAVLDPHDANVQFNLGVFFSQQQSWTNAVRCFENALIARPDFSRAQRQLEELRAGHPEVR
jgi:tetratricopeptide (TPR) repeat protein